MPNEYYSPSGWPVTGSSGESSPARSEMSAIQAAFDKLPILAGSALRIVRVNSSSTALESITLATANIATLTQVAAAIAAIPTPTPPDLTPYALLSDLILAQTPPDLTPYALLSGALFTGNVSYRGGGGVATNVAYGESALILNATGSSNSAFGFAALILNTTGRSNSAFGHSALPSNTTGSSNSAFGYSALMFNTTGSSNSAFGSNSGINLTTGTNNTLLGASAGTETALINVTTQNNQICVGNNSSTNAFIKVAWTVVSDARDKTDFSPIPHGLDFVSKLSPTAYRLIESRDNPFPIEDAPLRYGFLAQDILALEGCSPVVVNPSDPEHLKMTSDYLIPILVNAIKELKADFDAYKLAHP